MKTGWFVCVIVCLIVRASVVAGDANNDLLTPEEAIAINAAFPEEMRALLAEAGDTGRNDELRRQLIELVRKCKTADIKSYAENATTAEACRSVWTVAIRFVRDAASADARAEILDAWNSPFADSDLRQALLQLVALGDVWEKRMLSKPLFSCVRAQAVKNRIILDAFAYAAYNSGDEEALAFLKELQKSVTDVHALVSIQKALNWSRHKQNEGSDSPGPAEFPPMRVDLSKLDTLAFE